MKRIYFEYGNYTLEICELDPTEPEELKRVEKLRKLLAKKWKTNLEEIKIIVR